MIPKRITRLISKILQHPQIIKARFKGIYTDHASSLLTSKDLIKTPIKTVIDVGANVGNFIKAAIYVFPKAKIYAFEPVPHLYNKIKKIPNIHAFNIGLWDKNKTDFFYYNKKSDDDGSFLKPTYEYEEFSNTINQTKKIKFKQKRFDELKIEIKRPCLLKIDVEGAEDRVLQGFGIKLKEVDIIQMEWFFKNLHENQMKISTVISLLENFGFSGFIQNELAFIKGKPAITDITFFRA